MLVRTLASWILTVVVLCDHCRHTRDRSLLHTPLIDVPWDPDSSQDECSVLTRNFSPSAFRHASPLGTLMISSLYVSCTWLRRRLHSDPRDKLSCCCSSSCRRKCAFQSVPARSRQCVNPSKTSTCRSVSTLRRSWVNSIIFCCRASCAALTSDMRWPASAS